MRGHCQGGLAYPIHGRITAILDGDAHHTFWTARLPDGDLTSGEEQPLTISTLVTAWSTTVT